MRDDGHEKEKWVWLVHRSLKFPTPPLHVMDGHMRVGVRVMDMVGVMVTQGLG